jgi:hypothetical protein
MDFGNNQFISIDSFTVVYACPSKNGMDLLSSVAHHCQLSLTLTSRA